MHNLFFKMKKTVQESKPGIDKWFNSDVQFNNIYPSTIQLLASKHWTPLAVARKAANFLAAEKNVRILDIGSGVGKFCLAAAYHKPDAFYFGVEQRKSLINHAEVARETLKLDQVSFIHGNFTQLNFKDYDHFYFYNAFYENLVGTFKIDDSIEYSAQLFHYYNTYLFRLLEKKPAGTRLATFHSMEDEVPSCYYEVGSEMDNLLKFWIKA